MVFVNDCFRIKTKKKDWKLAERTTALAENRQHVQGTYLDFK